MNYFAARGQLLLWLPIGQTETEWLLNVHGGQNRSRASQYQHVGVNLEGIRQDVRLFFKDTNPPSPMTDRGGYRDRDGDPFAGDYEKDGPENIDLFGANLEVTWSFGDSFELRSLTAYEWHDLHRLENADGSPYFSLTYTYDDTAWQFSQQLDLRGAIGESKYGGGDWILGVYYIQEDLDVVNYYDQETESDLDQRYIQEMWNFAGYGQMEYRLRPGCAPVSCDFTLLAGLRYNWEHKSFDTSVVNLPSKGQVRTALDGEDATLWGGPSGEFSLAWDYSEDSNLYVKYSRGWKGGHFNGGAVSVFDIVTAVNPEIVDSYETGLRSNWFEDRLKLNLTAFYYDYQDLQVFILEQTELGYPIPKLANASDATVYGVELDLMSEPIDGLRLTLNAAWVESEYKEFVVTFSDKIRFTRNRPGPPPNPKFIIVPRKFDYSGNTLIASPTFSATASIEYDIPLPGQIAGRGLGTLTPRFSFNWKDEMIYDACGGRGNRCNFTTEIVEGDGVRNGHAIDAETAKVVGKKGYFGQEPFWIVNAALTWTSENEMLTLTGWVRNFLDEHYKSQSWDNSQGLGIILDIYADPRTYGITATLAF
jgi:outer membrane receptor protein involved in Fe transport